MYFILFNIFINVYLMYTKKFLIFKFVYFNTYSYHHFIKKHN